MNFCFNSNGIAKRGGRESERERSGESVTTGGEIDLNRILREEKYFLPFLLKRVN